MNPENDFKHKSYLLPEPIQAYEKMREGLFERGSYIPSGGNDFFAAAFFVGVYAVFQAETLKAKIYVSVVIFMLGAALLGTLYLYLEKFRQLDTEEDSSKDRNF